MTWVCDEIRRSLWFHVHWGTIDHIGMYWVSGRSYFTNLDHFHERVGGFTLPIRYGTSLNISHVARKFTTVIYFGINTNIIMVRLWFRISVCLGITLPYQICFSESENALSLRLWSSWSLLLGDNLCVFTIIAHHQVLAEVVNTDVLTVTNLIQLEFQPQTPDQSL